MNFALNELCQQVMTARAAEWPLYIRGGGTKDFYGERRPGALRGSAVLDMSGLCGIVNYQPSELVITARAGTPLAEIEAVLYEQEQMLAFEPPRFGPASTIGGMVASGLSGPRRMAAGGLRDYVLGTKLLDASGLVLNFGGEVMKNVAGYDISRLLAGSMGIFGALVEVSLKVAPLPGAEQTQVLEMEEAEALARFNAWRSRPLPVSATCWVADDGRRSGPGRLFVRLSGSEPAVQSGAGYIGGDRLPDEEAGTFWASLRDQTHDFFARRPLWRIAVPPNAPPLDEGATLIEWNGGLRWVAGAAIGQSLRERIARHGGHATLYHFDVGDKPANLPVFHPQHASLRQISLRLKQELDPAGVFNPCRLFPDF